MDTHSCQVHSLKKNKSSFIIKYFFATTRNDVTKRPFWTHFRKPWKSVFNSSKIPINIFTSLILKIYPFLHVYYTKFTKIIHFSNNPHVILIFISYLDCPHNIYEWGKVPGNKIVLRSILKQCGDVVGRFHLQLFYLILFFSSIRYWNQWYK